MSKKLMRPGIICLGLIVLVFAVLRDVHYDKEYMGDLRNRVVGARMIEDGRSPYFYKWKKGDGPRYYDPNNFDTLQPSIITSTPFLHRLLIPLADLPQARISDCWLVLQYLLLVAMTFFAWRCAGSSGARMAVILVCLLFLLSNAWKQLMANGQSYLLLPAAAMLLFACLRQKKGIGWAIPGGFAAATVVLLRPYGLLLFIPLLPLAGSYTRGWLAGFALPVVLLGAWIGTSPSELGLWKDYRHMLEEQVKVHQDLPHAGQHNEPDPHYARWEGIDLLASDEAMLHRISPIYSENGNVFVLYRLFTHRKLSVTALALGLTLVLAGLTALYFARARRQAHDLTRAMIAGYCLYMTADLFSPIYRHQYYSVQWIFPLLLAASIWPETGKKGWYGIIAAGMLLWILHFPFVKMGNTIGEYLIFMALVAISVHLRGPVLLKRSPAGTS